MQILLNTFQMKMYGTNIGTQRSHYQCKEKMISLTGSTLNSQKDTNNTHTDNNPIDENNAKFFYIIKSYFKGTNKQRKM